MIDTTLPKYHGTPRVPQHMTTASGSLQLIRVFLPIAVIGIAAASFGLGFMASGILISLAYVVSVLIATRTIRSDGTGWTQIGLGRPASLRRTALFVVLALVGAIFVINVMQLIAVNIPGLALEPPDESRFDSVIGNVPLLVVGVIAAWTTIGFGEEMLFRAFLINKFARLLNSTRIAWTLAVIGSSVIFGVAHFGGGPAGIATNGAFGAGAGDRVRRQRTKSMGYNYRPRHSKYTAVRGRVPGHSGLGEM